MRTRNTTIGTGARRAITVAALLVAGTAPLAAADDSPLPAPRGQTEQVPARTVIALDHPANANTVFQSAAETGVELVVVRHEQQFVGEYFPALGASAKDSIRDYREIVGADYGTQPRVVAVEVTPGTDQRAIDQFLTEAGEAATFTPAPPRPGLAGRRMSRAIESARTVEAAEGTPPAFAAAAVPVVAPSWAPGFVTGKAFAEAGRAKFYSFMNWTGTHSPRKMPFDWGFEYDWSLYNSSRPATDRPNCPSANDRYFWAARHPNEIRSWSMWVNGTGLNGSDNYGAYLDANDLFDSCRRLGFAVGIGWPRNMPTNPSVEVLITADRGSPASSPYAVYLQASSNDCFAVPDSNCMGLNTARQFPGPGRISIDAVPQDKGWTAPGCFTYSSVNAGTTVNKRCPAF